MFNDCDSSWYINVMKHNSLMWNQDPFQSKTRRLARKAASPALRSFPSTTCDIARMSWIRKSLTLCIAAAGVAAELPFFF